MRQGTYSRPRRRLIGSISPCSYGVLHAETMVLLALRRESGRPRHFTGTQDPGRYRSNLAHRPGSWAPDDFAGHGIAYQGVVRPAPRVTAISDRIFSIPPTTAFANRHRPSPSWYAVRSWDLL